ncbi:hypothetical protein YC2023_121644 [Brassica napus]
MDAAVYAMVWGDHELFANEVVPRARLVSERVETGETSGEQKWSSCLQLVKLELKLDEDGDEKRGRVDIPLGWKEETSNQCTILLFYRVVGLGLRRDKPLNHCMKWIASNCRKNLHLCKYFGQLNQIVSDFLFLISMEYVQKGKRISPTLPKKRPDYLNAKQSKQPLNAHILKNTINYECFSRICIRA